jgi:hypothetical protein
MINILDARVCQHCGCVYIPAADYKGACPISTEHTVYISVSLMLAYPANCAISRTDGNLCFVSRRRNPKIGPVK